ncbi:hypothetical protein TNCV_3362651 [Trichonephila clavipes]|nr:hypothetical protein TNCV_3362651 [Trichonephila clavipes]
MLLWTRSLPGQLTVTVNIQWRIVIKGGKMVTVVFGAFVGHLQVSEETRRGRLPDYAPLVSNELRIRDRFTWAHQ